MPNPDTSNVINGVLLGFDFGFKKIGVAVGNQITLTASPLKKVPAKDGIPDWAIIDELYNAWQPIAAVVGIPYNMDGTAQETTYAAIKFSNRLQSRYQMPIHHADERQTSLEAKKALHSRQSIQCIRPDLDSLAAKIILESWLNDLTIEASDDELP